MAALFQLTAVACPQCKVNLLRCKDSKAGDMVFCTECLAGGCYKEVIEQQCDLTRQFVTRQFVQDLLREIQAASK